MKKRIYSVMTAAVMAAILILSVIITAVYYNFYKVQSENDVKALARVFVSGNQTAEEFDDSLVKNFPYDIRITVIDKDGTVSYDSNRNMAFENHLNRKEIADAFETGTGEDIRNSASLGKKAYYFALRYGDSQVIRFSREIDSILSMFLTIIPFIIIVAFLVTAVSTVISSKLSDSVIRPVNDMVSRLDIFSKEDRAHPIEVEYDELRPVALTVKYLADRADGYIARLKEEKEKIRLITDNMVEGMIILDSGLNILSVNSSAVKILNPDFVQDGEKHLLHLTRNNDIVHAAEDLQHSEKKSADLLLDGGNGRFYRVFFNKTCSDNQNLGLIILLVDVTESYKAEEMRRDFAANVSHELKTPLTTIKGFGEMLSEGILSEPSDIKKYGATIFRESERLLFLINDIIRLSEIEDGGAARETTPVNLMDCAIEAQNVLRPSAEEKGVSLSVSGVHAAINGNRSYLNELVLNLADNAVKYNNKGGSVEINVGVDGGDAVLSVSDNGIGIPREHQSRIFERFYRVDKSRSKQTGGTGLGLSIVKHIAAYHGGTVSLESDEGKGTTITVRFPGLLNNI